MIDIYQHIKQLTNTQLSRLIRHLITPETITFLGDIKFYELPGDTDWSEEEFKRYWPILFADKRYLERILAYETHNLLTTAGRTQLLTYIGSTSGTSVAFAQYFSIGTGGIISVSPGDTSIAGELFRVVPSTATITGTQNDLQSQVGTTQAVGTWTSCGLWGNGATSTLGTGTLYTHALIANFVKANGIAYAVDYAVNQN